METKRTQLIGTAILATGFGVMTAYTIARRMPYLLNMNNMWAYFGATLLLALMFSIYLLFFHQSKEPKLNSATLRLSKKDKLKAVIGAVGCSAMLAWPSWSLVGLSAHLFSWESYFELFTIDSLEPGGRKGWDVKLIDRKTQVEYSLTLSRQYMRESFPWKEGEVVCAKGRTSFFGTIIEYFNAGECKLEGFRLELKPNKQWDRLQKPTDSESDENNTRKSITIIRSIF
jgi:hypothetical protein